MGYYDRESVIAMFGQLEGRIIQSIGGFYYVEAANAVYECRARGIFRKNGMTPLVGDRVAIDLLEEGKAALSRILERRNSLIRPPVANLDCLVIVIAVAEPAPVPLVIDQMVAIAEKNGIAPVIVINKADLGDTARWEDTYRLAGLPVYTLSAFDPPAVQPLRTALAGRMSAFTGNSGVGKSSLLNAMYPDLKLATGEISQKLGRGRHTTRSVSLYPLPEGGYIADTPGFSSLDMERAQPILKDELPACFREFAPYLGQCRFTSCAHVKEKDCAVRQAVEEGRIAPSRYESYVALFEQVKDKEEWNLR